MFTISDEKVTEKLDNKFNKLCYSCIIYQLKAHLTFH